jgi:hypothetical protein
VLAGAFEVPMGVCSMLKLPLIIVIAAGALVYSSPARSDEYPVLNVAPVCHGIASQSDLESGLNTTDFDQCMKSEQTDREAMIKEWSTFSADDKRHCITETTMGNEASYTDLVTCMEMARDVRELNKQPDSLSEQNIPPAPVGHRQPTR